MYRGKTVSVVVPCYNESTQIQKMIATIPDYIDAIYAVDDCSRDDTRTVLFEVASSEKRLRVLVHDVNRGVGAAIGTGYLGSRKDRIDISVVMAGDGQMDPADLPNLLDPVVDDLVDYAKGNRFIYSGGIERIPRVRLFGNFVLSALTKVSSGYWNVSDTQCGYTAVNLLALDSIDPGAIYPRYGCPNDILTKLNIANMRVGDVPVAPLYHIGEESKMKIPKVIGPILKLLWKNFRNRLFIKYIVRSGHPLVISLAVGVLMMFVVALLAVYISYMTFSTESIPKAALITAGFVGTAGLQFLISAMEMDYNDNRPLQITRLDHRRYKPSTQDKST